MKRLHDLSLKKKKKKKGFALTSLYMFSSSNCRWMSSSRRRANLRANEKLCFGFATHVFVKKLQMDELVEEADC